MKRDDSTIEYDRVSQAAIDALAAINAGDTGEPILFVDADGTKEAVGTSRTVQFGDEDVCVSVTLFRPARRPQDAD